MNRYFSFALLLLVCVLSHATTISVFHSIYGNVRTGDNVCVLPEEQNSHIRTRLHNAQPSNNPLAIVIQEAQSIFNAELQSMYIETYGDIIPIYLVDDGSVNFADDEICKVEIRYTDSIGVNLDFPFIGNFRDQSSENTLYPCALANISHKCLKYDTVGAIYLNGNLSFAMTRATTIPDNEYDAISVIIRGLTMIHGFHSSLSIQNPQPADIGITINGTKYLTCYDRWLTNNDGDILAMVLENHILLSEFLRGKRVLFKSSPADSYIICNEWEYDDFSDILSHKTLNTFSLEESVFDEIMCEELLCGDIIRKLTPKTRKVLETIGWFWNISVDNDYNDPIHDMRISGPSVLQPGNSYTYSTQGNCVPLDTKCVLYTQDSIYTFCEGNGMPFNVDYHNSLPRNVKWVRNNLSKNAIGEIRCKLYTDWYPGTPEELRYPIEFSCPPNNIQYSKEAIEDTECCYKITVFANGANRYTISYQGSIDRTMITQVVETDLFIDTVCVDNSQLYKYTIYSENHAGNSDTITFSIGADDVLLVMSINIGSNFIKYFLSHNGLRVEDAAVSSVRIVDTSGNLMMTSSAGPGQLINTSSLRGPAIYYIVVTLENGRQLSQRFAKR